MYGHPDFFGPGERRGVVLFARRNSVYKSLGADCFDADRDARTYHGPLPVVAHPPCRGWGRLRQFAKVGEGELALGLFAVHVVRTWGGVLEHPAGSRLWNPAGLPRPGTRDEWGGFTLPVYQSWWGHRAPKPTWLYVVGCDVRAMPEIPFELGIPAGRVELMGRAEREATPVAFARWLLDLAARCRSQHVTVKSAAKCQIGRVS